MKQETLEEAAEKRIPTSSKVWDLTETRRNDFIAGALWQQEQDKKLYSEEEVINLVDNILQHADKVIDAITNENTDWDAESLFEICKNK